MKDAIKNKNDYNTEKNQGNGSWQLALKLIASQWHVLSWRYTLFVLATLSFGLIVLLPAQFYRYFTENTQNLGESTATEFLWHLATFGALIAIAMFITTLGRTLIQEWLRLKVETNLRRQVLQRLHKVPLPVLDGAQRGEWLTRMTGDLSQTERFLTDSIPNQIQNVAILMGAGILFAHSSGTIAILPLASAAVLAVFNLKIQTKLAPVLRDLRTMHGGVFQLLIESLEGIRTIRSHKAEPYIQGRFEKKLMAITRQSFQVVRVLGALMGSSQLLSQIVITACLSVAAWGLFQGRLTIPQLLVYPFFIGLFYGAAQSLAASAYEWNRFFSEGGRLAELLFEESEHTSIKSISTNFIDFKQAKSLSIEKLSIGYDGQKLVGPLDFQIQRGELYAIMGPSGCGKSTFLEVMAGLRPAMSGTAVVNNVLGEQLWDSHSFHELQLPIGPAAYVEQQPYIFEGTIRDNLTFGNPDRLSDTLLWGALERTNLFHFVRLNGGLKYFLKDRGQNLSEGERYRIALCRALLLGRPFLLLDEPFAALDEATIHEVVSTLMFQKASSGILIVTHQLPDGLSVDGTVNFDHAHQQRMGLNPQQVLPISQFSTQRTSDVSETALNVVTLKSMKNHKSKITEGRRE